MAKVHRIVGNRGTMCGLSFGSDKSFAATEDDSRVTCKVCLAAVARERRRRALVDRWAEAARNAGTGESNG